MSPSPLARFQVLDLTRARAGPTAVRQLADWGAGVIKIDPPATVDAGKGIGGDRHGSDFQNIQRNKRFMTLNLKAPQGVAIFKRLVEGVDVVVENYRPDVKKRLGIDYDTLSAVNPRLVYASISGFGQDGPYAKRPGFDQIAQGMGGLMSVTGLPGQGPVRVGVPIADLSSGLYLALGIMIALLDREVTGEGQWVRTSLLEAQIAMLDFQATRWLIDKEVPPQAGNNHPTSIPTGTFRTRDGLINIAGGGQTMWNRLCGVLKDEDLRNDPRFAEDKLRSTNRDQLNQALQRHFETHDSAHWIEALNAAGMPCGPVYSIDQVFDDPQVKHLDMPWPVDHPLLGRQELLGQPVTMSRSTPRPTTPTPERGQHTDAVLGELGYDSAAIEDLKARAIV